jgi:hypothetical protein
VRFTGPVTDIATGREAARICALIADLPGEPQRGADARERQEGAARLGNPRQSQAEGGEAADGLAAPTLRGEPVRRLAALGLTLPRVPEPRGAFLPFSRLVQRNLSTRIQISSGGRRGSAAARRRPRRARREAEGRWRDDRSRSGGRYDPYDRYYGPSYGAPVAPATKTPPGAAGATGAP